MTTMVSGLTGQVTEMAEAQKVMDGKLERVGTVISEVRERLTAAGSREKEGGAKMAQCIGAQQEAIDRMLMVPTSGAASSGSASAGPRGGGVGQQHRAQQDGVEHIVLLQFSTPRLLGKLVSVEPKKFCEFLAVKLRSFAEAAEYTELLRDKRSDPEGRRAEVIHKGRGRQGLPIIKRGEMLAILCAVRGEPSR